MPIKVILLKHRDQHTTCIIFPVSGDKLLKTVDLARLRLLADASGAKITVLYVLEQTSEISESLKNVQDLNATVSNVSNTGKY